MTAATVVLRDVEVAGERVDVAVADGVITALGATLPPGLEELHGGGGALLPGLHDHHLHLLATAAAATSVDLGAPGTDLADALRRADREQPAGAWLRAVGYHASLAGDLDRDSLDRLVPTRPVRVQDRSGARWTLNGAAIDALGLADAAHPGIERDGRGRPTGRLHRADEWLRDRLPPAALPDLRALGLRLTGLGVTGVTDTSPTVDPSAFHLLAGAVRDGSLPQRVTVTGGPELTGAEVPRELATGPVKLVLDDADYPAIEGLVEQIDAAHRHERGVAFHTVTRTSLVLAIAALEAATRRPGDRLEHGAVIPLALLPALRGLDLTVVTQPGFVHERGDAYLRDVDPDDLGDLYRCGSLLAAGIPVAASTDAPYTALDPWAAIRAAVDRRTRRGAVVGGDERVDAATALGLFLGPGHDPGGTRRRVAVGEPADLCLVDRPLTDLLAEPTADAVAATVIRGRVVHRR